MPRMISDDALAVVTIWQEARGEPFVGKLAVAHVIRNRIKRKYQSDGTVAGTVLAPYQFSGWNSKDPSRPKSVAIVDEDKVVDECRSAWEISKHVDEFPAVLFHASSMGPYPSWSSHEKVTKVAEIGGHIFYDEVD